MRIIHIIPTLRKGGAERLALDICTELSKRDGIEVALIVLSNENNYLALSDKAFVKFIPSKVVPSISGKTVVAINELMHFIHQFKPDVIHSHLFEAEVVSRYQLIKGIKYFSHCHDNMHQLKKFSWKTLFDKKLLTEYYERLLMLRQYKICNNSFITISKHTENYFKSILPASLPVYQMHNAIHFDTFNNKQHHLNALPLRLINVGSFNQNKNQKFLVNVLQELKKLGAEDVVLTFCGAGKTEMTVREMVKNLHLQNQVIFKGEVDHVEHFLFKNTMYVHSALSEAMGLTMLEAMAAGLPVVCLDGGGNRDIIEQNKNGIMIYEQDAKAFANAILKIASDEKLYQQMSAYAVKYASKFDIKPYTDKLLKLYLS